MMRGMRIAAMGGNTPSLISGWPIFVSSVATAMSQASASSQPPPMAEPLRAATVGSGNTIRRLRMPWKTSIICTTLSGV